VPAGGGSRPRRGQARARPTPASTPDKVRPRPVGRRSRRRQFPAAARSGTDYGGPAEIVSRAGELTSDMHHTTIGAVGQ